MQEPSPPGRVFIHKLEVIGMTKEDQTRKEKPTMSGHFIFEMRRQMTSGQMRRFVRSLPAFQVENDAEDPFSDLLEKIDAASAEAHDDTSSTRARS
jgi:hypothetical protein